MSSVASSVLVDDRDDVEVVLGEQARHGLLIHVVGDADDVGLHDVGDELLWLRREQVAKRHDAHQPLLAVEDVRDVDRLELRARLPPQVEQGLVGGHVRAQPGKARRHEATGLVLGVREQREHFFARRIIE
jgi:hypothetical protein